jgi:hypothetical protein
MDVRAGPIAEQDCAATRPNSPAIGEQQMDPVESATALALPGGGNGGAGG